MQVDEQVYLHIPLAMAQKPGRLDRRCQSQRQVAELHERCLEVHEKMSRCTFLGHLAFQAHCAATNFAAPTINITIPMQIYRRTYLQMYLHMHLQMYLQIYIYIYIYVHMHADVYVCRCICMYMYMYADICAGISPDISADASELHKRFLEVHDKMSGCTFSGHLALRAHCAATNFAAPTITITIPMQIYLQTHLQMHLHMHLQIYLQTYGYIYVYILLKQALAYGVPT